MEECRQYPRMSVGGEVGLTFWPLALRIVSSITVEWQRLAGIQEKGNSGGHRLSRWMLIIEEPMLAGSSQLVSVSEE